MRVIALGGAGDMGSYAVRELARHEEVTELMIADFDEDRANALATELGSRCRSMMVDAENPADLSRAVEGYDVAMSAIGPFYKYEKKVAGAAVEAGVDYVSICDDYDAALELFDLDDEASKRGVTVLTGMGWTPGLSNILARLGADRLDEVEEVAVAWAGSASDSEGYAVILHTIHIFTGFVPSFQNGRQKLVQAGSGKEKAHFPAPVGDVFVYHLGHPEPVTIPRFISVPTVTLKGGLSEEELNRVSILLSRLRLTSTNARKDRLGKVIKAASPVLFRLGKPDNPCSAIRVDVTGRKSGEWTSFTFGAAEHMNLLTGTPLAIGALMLGRGLISKKGVQAPESCVDPDLFLEEAAVRGLKVFEGERFDRQIN
jgi:saccharopine dehydrogenase-like NADP-dependent oxidoreductase